MVRSDDSAAYGILERELGELGQESEILATGTRGNHRLSALAMRVSLYYEDLADPIDSQILSRLYGSLRLGHPVSSTHRHGCQTPSTGRRSIRCRRVTTT